jgi:methylmalonyl-CoA mutase cobalamin-binding domain/chain
VLEQITSSLADLDERKVLQLVGEELTAGQNPAKILQALQEGAREIGVRYEAGNYFISELVVGASILQSAIAVVTPHTSSGSSVKGEMVLGTIQGDIHDIGKTILSALLSAEGVKVHDLGVDVPPAKFVEKAKETHSSVIGISVLLSVASLNVREVVNELNNQGLRGKIKVIVGGAAATEELVKKFAVDAVTISAVEGVAKIKSLMETEAEH